MLLASLIFALSECIAFFPFLPPIKVANRLSPTAALSPPPPPSRALPAPGYGLSPYPRGPRRSDYSLWRQSSCTVLPALRSPCVCFPPRSVDLVAGLRGPRLLDLRIGGARRHVCNSRARPELRIAVLVRRLRTQFLPPNLCLSPWPGCVPVPPRVAELGGVLTC